MHNNNKLTLDLQFTTAIETDDVETVSRLVESKQINISQIKISIDCDDSSYGRYTKKITPLQFVIRNGSIKMLRALLTASDVEINSGNDTYDLPPLVLAIEGDKNAMLSELLKDPRINPNTVFSCVYGRQITPLMYAFYCNRLAMFGELLKCPSTDIHTILEINTGAVSNKKCVALHCIHDSTRYDHNQYITLLVKHYCHLMIEQPDVVKAIFQIYPDLSVILSLYRAQLFGEVQAQVHLMAPHDYFDLLKNIDRSEHQEKSLQHPLYTVFSTKSSRYPLLQFMGSFFYPDELVELQQIKKMVSSVEPESLCVKQRSNYIIDFS